MFHARDGWLFERTVDGGVHIIKRESAIIESPVVTEIYLNHNVWCSVISSVAAFGGTSKKFNEALGFHGHALGEPAASLPTEKGK